MVRDQLQTFPYQLSGPFRRALHGRERCIPSHALSDLEQKRGDLLAFRVESAEPLRE
jgi:hypothetical protein